MAKTKTPAKRMPTKTGGISNAAKNLASTTKKDSTPKKNDTKAGAGYVAPTPTPVKVDTSKNSNNGKNNNGVYAVGSAAGGGTIMSDKSIVGGKTGNNNGGGTNNNGGGTTKNYVSAKNNGDGTTTYTKLNGDSWTENGKGQVVSKVVKGGGMSVANQSNTTSKTNTSNPIDKSNPVFGVGNVGALSPANSLDKLIANTSRGGTSKVPVATNMDGSIRYRDGTSSKTSTTKGGGTTTNNGYMSYDYTKNNAKGSPAVQQLKDGSIRYADNTIYNPNTGKTTTSKTSAGTFGNNISSILKNSTTKNNSTVASNGYKSWDYTKNNANGSPAVQQMADGSIRYADNTVYNPKTGQTTDSKGNVVKDQTQATQVTEDTARYNANERNNRTSSTNSSNYNPISNNKGATTNRSNQSALSIVLGSQGGKVGDGQNNVVGLQSKSLDTGGNRNIASQEQGLTDNGDGTQTYIAPNGKQYSIWQDGEGRWATDSSVDGQGFFIGDGKDINELVNFIRDNNASDGINRTNVDNRDAVRDAKVVGTYNAPSGKEYDILTNDEGKVGFVNIRGEAQWFDSQNAALDYIDRNNPVGSTDTSKNTIKPEWQNRVSDSIQDMNENVEDRKEEERDKNEDLLDWMENFEQEWNDKWDEVDRNNYDILNQSLNDWGNFQAKLDDAVADLEEKSKLVQDGEKMRRARQRAQQLADMGYLTSEQVAQVANYSLADYNRELEQGAREAAQAIAQLRIDIAQKANDALASIRDKQFANESNRLAQINFVNEWRAKMEDSINARVSQYDQTYNGMINSNLAMNAQNELGYESIINQNRAQNVVDDQNMIRALSNSAYRRQYILSQISDVNLHPYAEQLMNRLQNQNKFLIRDGGIEKQKSDLAKQISAIVDAARQQQLIDQKNLAKS